MTEVTESRKRFDNLPLREHKTRITLEHLRRTILLPFDIVKLAQVSGVGEMLVYRALLKQPIARTDAVKILEGLSKIHDVFPPLTLADVDIPVYDDLQTLFVAHASGAPDSTDEFVLVYAQDEDHARKLLKHWIEPVQAAGNTIKVTNQQEGIPIYGSSRIPGHIGEAKD